MSIATEAAAGPPSLVAATDGSPVLSNIDDSVTGAEGDTTAPAPAPPAPPAPERTGGTVPAPAAATAPNAGIGGATMAVQRPFDPFRYGRPRTDLEKVVQAILIAGPLPESCEADLADMRKLLLTLCRVAVEVQVRCAKSAEYDRVPFLSVFVSAPRLLVMTGEVWRVPSKPPSPHQDLNESPTQEALRLQKYADRVHDHHLVKDLSAWGRTTILSLFAPNLYLELKDPLGGYSA